MGRIVGDLVDVGSISSGKLVLILNVGKPADVVAEAVGTFSAHAEAAGVALVVEALQPDSVARFDHARILQVLINLLCNAIKFTAKGGTVTVRSRCAEEVILLSVSDTGSGIPSDMLNAIFAPYVQVKDDRRGVGLGLYIAKALVDGHGGRIWAESTVGKGTTFYFTLPRA
jgi:signal transduction histidine kinase